MFKLPCKFEKSVATVALCSLQHVSFFEVLCDGEGAGTLWNALMSHSVVAAVVSFCEFMADHASFSCSAREALYGFLQSMCDIACVWVFVCVCVCVCVCVSQSHCLVSYCQGDFAGPNRRAMAHECAIFKAQLVFALQVAVTVRFRTLRVRIAGIEAIACVLALFLTPMQSGDT